MHGVLCALLAATAVLAEDSQERRSKLPYIADAVGNSLPAPSMVPATVGSPVNLLTPDRYEFYTFDESGELVKRLMTLEEIQAIVAAGEDTEGLVTFANDNQPTIAFNFSQPSYTKVHNVVTNVQNVLKAQIEAHKNRTNVQPTLDTPDVSDSWSQILPSIFGNTGVDIVPDRTSGTFITPETDTIEFENTNESKDNDLIPDKVLTNDIPVKIESTTLPTTSTTKSTTTRKIITTTKTTTTSKPTFTTPKIVKSSTVKLLTTTTTKKPSTTIRSTYTTKTKATSTTPKPTTSSTEKYKSTTKLNVKVSASTKDNSNKINEPAKVTPQYEKFSTFIPTNAPTKSTAKTTEKPSTTTKSNIIASSTTVTSSQPLSSTEIQRNYNVTESPTTEQKFDNVNATTITTQSIAPFTTISSTDNAIQVDKNTIENLSQQGDTNIEPALPLFDVAQSISQIASDLGNYAPLPTSEDSLDTEKVSDLSMESKENLEFDIPADAGQENTTKIENNINNNFENYVKITTLDPQKSDKGNETNSNHISNAIDLNHTFEATEDSKSTTVSSFDSMDPILSNSVEDMLFQVINENPNPNSFIDKNSTADEPVSTTLTISETTTSLDETESTTISDIADIESTSIPVTTSSVILTDEDNDKKTKMSEEVEKLHLKTHVLNTVSKEETKSQTSTKNNTFFETVNELNISTDKGINSSSDLFKYLGTINNTLLLITSSTTTQSPSKVEITTKHTIDKNNERNESSEVIKSSVLKNINQKDINKLKTNIELPKVDEIKKKFQKVNIDEKEIATDRNSWKLIPTVPPPKSQESEKIKQKLNNNNSESTADKDIILDFSNENQGLEVTTKDLGQDVEQFTELCNELAFKYWEEIIPNIDNKRSFVLSPFSVTSMLAMMFMGARGATSGEMNEILKLDDMVTFNPHFTLKNISDSIETSSNSGVAVSAFIRELYSERSKGKILTFYKERAQHFYNGHVEEVNFKLISDIIRRRTNLLVKRYTWGKIPEYIKSNYISMHPPLAAFSTNIFETDCTGSSVEGRDGEMYFVVSPTVRQRRLVPVPAVVYKNNFMAGYDPALDATAAALGNTNSLISTLFLMPGQQGNVVNAEDLESLEKRLLESKPAVSTWNRLLRTLLPRIGLELQIPRFSHKSMLNVSAPLKKMGLKELFDSEHADLAGLNGPSKDIYLSDILQLTTFATCGEGTIGEQHHIEEYPEISMQKRRSSRWATIWDEPRDYQRAFHDPHDLGDAMHLPLHLRPRQARLPARNTQPARRLKFDRPFLYFVRHNPTGMILYVGRYNPRLLP